MPGAVGADSFDDAHQLWIRIRGNADKAIKLPAGDPNKGWLERAIEADGRELFTVLSRPEFDRYAVVRGKIRARLLFVVRPPAPDDRREAMQSIDQDFAELLKRRGGAPPAAPPSERAPS